MSKSWQFSKAASTLVFVLTMVFAAESSQSKVPQYQGNLADAQQTNNLSNQKITVVNLGVISASSSNQGNKISRQNSASISTKKVDLASHLKQIGAKFYGAFWCPYCSKQKEMFGEQAFRQINYIECDPRGKNPRPDLCRKASIQGFPTWEINGKQYPGMKSLAELAELSGYKGDRHFGN
jgi:protein-disulfide isomerase